MLFLCNLKFFEKLKFKTSTQIQRNSENTESRELDMLSDNIHGARDCAF